MGSVVSSILVRRRGEKIVNYSWKMRQFPQKSPSCQGRHALDISRKIAPSKLFVQVHSHEETFWSSGTAVGPIDSTSRLVILEIIDTGVVDLSIYYDFPDYVNRVP